MKLSLPHTLEPAEAVRRIEALAEEHQISIKAEPGGLSGELERSMGFAGTVRARYRVEPGSVEIEVLKRPPLVPEGLLRRSLEDELGRRLG